MVLPIIRPNRSRRTFRRGSPPSRKVGKTFREVGNLQPAPRRCRSYVPAQSLRIRTAVFAPTAIRWSAADNKRSHRLRAYSKMPHEFRGVCTNCHLHTDPGRLNATPYGVQAGTPVAAVRPVIAPPPTAPAKTPTEGEWLGLEVTPITPLTARQYSIPDGMQGLVVAEAEAGAATAGVRAGDVVVAINGLPITQMTEFFQATRNGTSTQGTVEIVRQGQRLAIDLASTTAPAQAALPNTTINVAFPAGQRAAMAMRQGNFAMTPAAGAWGGGQGLGSLGAAYPGVGWQQGNVPMAPPNAGAWGGGQGLGSPGAAYPGPCWQRQF